MYSRNSKLRSQMVKLFIILLILADSDMDVTLWCTLVKFCTQMHVLTLFDDRETVTIQPLFPVN